jgi:hypothetical protein
MGARSARRWIGVVVMATVAVLGGCAGTATARPLSTLVVTNLDGFVSVPRPHGVPDAPPSAGSLRIAGAASMFCDGVSRATLRQDDWQASYLRVWLDSTTNPSAIVNLCVSEMNDASDAARNYQEVLGSSSPKGLPLTKLPVPGIPGVHAGSVSRLGLDFVEFSKGDYVVTIVAEDLPAAGLNGSATVSRVALPVATVASAEFRRLPG